MNNPSSLRSLMFDESIDDFSERYEDDVNTYGQRTNRYILRIEFKDGNVLELVSASKIYENI